MEIAVFIVFKFFFLTMIHVYVIEAVYITEREVL